MKPHFVFQSLDLTGNPQGIPLVLYDAITVLQQVPLNMPLSNVNNFCEIARAAPGTPVIMNHWETERSGERALVWNASLTYFLDNWSKKNAS